MMLYEKCLFASAPGSYQGLMTSLKITKVYLPEPGYPKKTQSLVPMLHIIRYTLIYESEVPTTPTSNNAGNQG